MEKTIKNKVLIEKLTLFFGGFLLFTDVFFLLVAISADMPLMRYVIYVKLVINTTNIYLILKKHYLVSTVIIFSVILGFMIVGLVCVGTEAAFQLYALGMLACISYNGYMHNRVLKKELPFALMIAIHVLCYAGVYIYSGFYEPLYIIPEKASDILIIFNSVATFGIVILFICLFHHVAINTIGRIRYAFVAVRVEIVAQEHNTINKIDILADRLLPKGAAMYIGNCQYALCCIHHLFRILNSFQL